MALEVQSDRATVLAVDRRIRAAIVVVGVALTPLAAKTPWASSPLWAITVAGLGSSVALWWLSRRPGLVCLTGAVGYVISGNFWPLAIGLFACGATRRLRTALPALFVGGIAFVLHERFEDTAVTLSTVESAFALAAMIVAVGLYVGTQRELVASLREQAAQAAAERTLRDDRTRAAERARIAREMHDVVAHQITLIALQAGALEVNTTLDDSSLVRAAGVIRRTARQALTELREVLHTLGPNDEEKDLRPPFRSVDDVVRAWADAGATVTIDGDSTGLPSAVERAGVRVAQEAITNATRYAPGAPIHVEFDRAADGGATISIENGVSVGPTASTDGAGRGLVGLAERLRLLGGSLQAGPRAEGGWRVEATIPNRRAAIDEPISEPK